MAYESATNPTTGEKLFLVGDKWLPPSETATNPKTGQRAFLVNNEWQVLDTPKAAPVTSTAPVADSKGRFDANNQPRTPAVAAEPILSPEEQVASQVGAPSTAPIAPTVAAQPKPPSELNMGREFIEKGLPSGYIGLKSTAAGVNLLKEANFIGSAMKNLDVYKQIDEGKITSLADAEGLGLPKDQVRMYLAAKSPEAREQMKQNQQGIIEKRQGFVREGLNLFKQYQAEAEKVKGVTPDITDVGTVKDFGNWLAFNVGSGAVQLAPIILAALTTGGPGAFALGTTMGVGETVGNRLQFIQNKVKDLPPEQQADEIEKYIRDTADTTMAIGLASGALDLFGPVGSILRGRAGKEGVKYLTKKEALKAGAKAAPRDIVEEGLTGAGQEAVQIGGKRTLGEQKGDLFSEENIKDVINAAAAEAAGGVGGTTVNTGLKVAQAQAAQNQEKEAKVIEAQKKILDRLNAPGAMDALGQQFNNEVERLRNTINPKTIKKDGSGGRLYTEEEAYAIAGDAILQEENLDGLESTIGGTNQSGVSVPSGPSETDTGIEGTTTGDVAATSETTTAVGGGEGTELNTLAADLKAKYPQLTDEQALANAKESLRQKQMAAGMGAPTPTSALTPEQEQRRIDLRNILEAGTFDEAQGRAIVEELIALENLAEGDIAPPQDTTITEEEAPTDTTEDGKPPVKIGKPRGRPKTEKTPEQQAAAAEYRKQRQDIGKNALTEVTKAEKVLNRVVDEQAIIENSGTEKEAQDTLFGLREERIGALSVAYGLSVDPDQKNKTAGKRATALLEKADPQERELGKQRHEAKQKLSAPSRSEMTAQDLKDRQQLAITRRRLELQKPISIFTEAFKKWFGKSKIVNKDGTPKKMYHGTARDIGEFQPKQANAIFLTEDPKFAEGFTAASKYFMSKEAFSKLPFEQQEKIAKEMFGMAVKNSYMSSKDAQMGIKFLLSSSDSILSGAFSKWGMEPYVNKFMEPYVGNGPNIIPVYAKAEMPFDYENPDHVDFVIAALTPEEKQAALSNVSYDPNRLVTALQQGAWVHIESAPIQAAMRRVGFDGFYVREGGNKNLAVYNSNQIKSVFNQTPTEDANISRSEIIESTNGQDNPAFEKFNNAKGALNYIARKGNPFEKALAQRLVPFLNGVKFVIVDSEADMPTPKLQKFMKGAAGLFDPETNTIYVAREGGINNTVVLHEALHAATIAKINTYILLKNAKKPIPNDLRVAVAELYETMDEAKALYDQLNEAGMLLPEMEAIPYIAFTDVKEFVAYGLSLPVMQDFLLFAPGEYAGEAPGFISKLFNKFVQSLRKMFNMGENHKSALQDLMIVTNKLLDVQLLETVATGEPSQAKAKQPKAPKQLKMVENVLRKLRLSHSSSDMNTSIGQLIMQTRNANDAIRLVKAVYNTISVAKLKLVMRAFDTGDITRIAGDKLSNIKVINNAVEGMAGMRTRMIRELSEKVPAWINFNQKYKQGGKALADVINAATLLQVDPAKHPDAATAIKNDPDLQRIENAILNPSTDPKTLPNLKKQRTERTAAIKLLYEGGVLNNPITGEKFTMLGWDALGKFGKGEGHDIYRMARDSYKQTFDLHEKLLKEKIAASNVPGDVNDAATPKGKLIAAITKTFQEARLLDIYFPLMRYGNFWFSKGKGKSGEFYMFESATARNAAVEARVAELNKASGTNRSLDQMIADGDIDVGDDIRKLREKHVESSDMLKEIFAMLDSNKMTDIEAVKDNIYQMYLMTLPDKDIRRKFVHRQGKTGFSADAIRNFITSQHTAANQLSRLTYADKIRNGIAAAYAEIAQNPDKLKLAVIIREISARALDEITPSIPDEGIDWNKVASVGNKFVFYWLLTSPKSALIQMTQLPIVGLPTLGAEFGIGKATATAARYSALWNKFGIPVKDPDGNIITKWGQPSIGDSSYIAKHPDPAYRKMLKDAWNFANDKDIFMSTYAGDMTAMSEVPTAQYHNVISRGTRGVFNFMGGAFHHAERISREIMFMSSFELAYADYKQKGMDDKAAFNAATEKALTLTYDALFNYTQYNKPRLMKGSPGAKLATQFLTYPLQMTSYLVRNFYGMLPLLNKDEKKEAAIKFFGTLGMTGLFAGVTGFPLYSFIMGVAEGMRELMRDEEDEDYDEDDEGNPLGKRNLDLWFRNSFIPSYFGPDSNLASILGLTEEAAKTLARGVEMGPLSAYTGLNLGASTSLDGLWFRDDTPGNTSREAFQNFIFGFSGPIGSIGSNFAGAFDDFNNGQINRGFEKLAPAWLRGSLTAYRLSTEGATTTKGAEIKEAEFYTTGKLAAQALGFGNTEVAQIQKSNFMAKQVIEQIKKEKANLLNRLDVAVRNDDDDKVEEILDKITKFNTKNAMLPISGETVNKSLQSRAKARGKSYQGLSVADKEAPFIYPLVEGTRSPD